MTVTLVVGADAHEGVGCKVSCGAFVTAGDARPASLSQPRGGASATLGLGRHQRSDPTSEFGTGQSQVIANGSQQRHVGIQVQLMRLPVDGQFDHWGLHRVGRRGLGLLIFRTV